MISIFHLFLVSSLFLLNSCDYFHNMVGNKDVEKRTVALTVKDAITGEVLDGAYCAKDNESNPPQSSGNGLFVFTDLLSGKDTIACTYTDYLDDSLVVDILAGQDQNHDMNLLRDPKNWYAELDYQIDFNIPSKQRVPDSFSFNATLKNPNNLFKYSWTLKKSNSTPQQYTKSVDPILLKKIDVVYDSMELSMYAKSGNKEVFLGSKTKKLDWVVNKKPVLFFKPAKLPPLKICNTYKEIIYDAKDQDLDGECKEVVFNTSPTNSQTLGSIPNQIGECGVNKKITLSISNYSELYPNREETSYRDTFDLIAHVKDDNGQDSIFRLPLVFFTNRIPVISQYFWSPDFGGEGNYFLKNKEINLVLRMQDRDTIGYLDSVKIDWGDHSNSGRYLKLSHDSIITIPHTFQSAGDFKAIIKLSDECGEIVEKTLNIKIQENSPPQILVNGLNKDLNKKEHLGVTFRAIDDDANTYTDSVTQATIEWGDGGITPLDSLVRYQLNVPVRRDHMYSFPLKSTYLIRITSVDTYGALGIDSLLYTP